MISNRGVDLDLTVFVEIWITQQWTTTAIEDWLATTLSDNIELINSTCESF